MEGGICVAGVQAGSPAWIRPTTDTRRLSNSDVRDKAGDLIEPLDLVEFDLVRPEPSAPHVEDWLADFQRPVSVLSRPGLNVRQKVLEAAAESSPDPVLRNKKRSLVLVEPDRIEAAVFDPCSYSKYKVRLSFNLGQTLCQGESAEPGYPCTDLKLRAWGRRFGQRTELDDIGLRRLLQTERIFLAIGLTRPFRDNYWPMVVGFHTLPDFQASIDLSNP
jgi:hypothetical protein